MCSQQKVELLQAEVDENDQSFFRLLVDGRAIKYVTVEPGLYTVEDMCFGPSLVSLLPEFPPGDWNDGLVARDTNNGRPHFKHVARIQFPGIRHKWHGTNVNYLDIVIGKKLRTGIYEVTCPTLDTVVVAKFARFDWEIQYLEIETIAYEWIDGHEIGPRFLGHLIEDNRVIGLLIERITNARHAGPNDLAACQQTLSRLHRLGVHHGDTNRFNFLICGSKAVLIDFDTARKCDDQDALREEFDHLAESLQDMSKKGGGGLLC
jgi:predicted Ser/Thr protein kinase